MKLPVSFKLNTQKWRVEEHDALPYGFRGCVSYGNRIVYVARYTSNKKIPEKQRFTTFIHEITHAVLEDVAPHLNNETFVRNFSEKFAQVLYTSKF